MKNKKGKIYIIIFAILIMCFCFKCIQSRTCENGSLSPSNEDSIFGVGYAVRGYANVVAMMGAKWVKIPIVAWGMIESEPPRNNIHIYNWDKLDLIIKEYQNAGFNIQIVLKAACPWGAKGFAKGTEKWRQSYPPKENYWDDYAAFVSAVVERYDGDGYKDMPGLRYPIRYYEIESEAQHSIFWTGSVEEYGRLLKTAYEVAKKADPHTKIILSGMNFGNFFDDNPSQEEITQKIKHLSIKYKKELSFIRKTLAMGEFYDVVEFHYNRDYTGAIGTVKWLKEEMAKHGYRKEIWAGDAASVPWIANKTILEILSNPYHLQYQKVKTWFRAEQAKLSVKKFIVAAAHGVKKVILESIRDFPKGAYKGSEKECWFLAGFFEDDVSPRPVFYAFKQLSRKLDGFTEIEPLEEGDIYLYKIYFKDREPIYVAWSKSALKKINISMEAKTHQAVVEKIITSYTSLPEIKNVEMINGSLSITVDDTPVFVYKL